MKPSLFNRVLFLIAAAGCMQTGLAQDQRVTPSRPTAPDQTAPAVAPEAIAALEAMGGYLRSLKTFEVSSTTVTEEVVEPGIKLQFSGQNSLKVRRPDRLRAEVSSDRKQRHMFYDGRTMTLYGPRMKYYATVPAPSTIRETVELMAKKYGVEMPLIDLFYWGTEQAPLSGIKFAMHVGPATIDGAQTDHYVFREEGVDWQVWIQQGKDPLPRKLVITTTSAQSQPAYSAIMRWNLAPKLNEAIFAFKPPAGARRIPLQTADGKLEARQ